MAISNIGRGSGANAGDGISLYTAFGIVNDNFSDLEGRLQVVESGNITITGNVASTSITGEEIFAGTSGMPANDRALTVYGSIGLANGEITGVRTVEADTTLNLTTNAAVTNQVVNIEPGGNDSIVRLAGDTIEVVGNIIPLQDEVYDIGSPTRRFNDLYLSGSTIDLGGTTLSIVGGNLQIGGTDIKDVVTAAGVDYSEIQNTPTIPSNLNDLADVNTTSPANGDFLMYANGEWVNAVLLNNIVAGSNVSLLNNDAGYVTAADIAGGTLTVDVNNTGDLTGSVFADDSTLLVDGVNGVIPASVVSGTITNTIDTTSVTNSNGNLSVTSVGGNLDLEAPNANIRMNSFADISLTSNYIQMSAGTDTEVFAESSVQIKAPLISIGVTEDDSNIAIGQHNINNTTTTNLYGDYIFRNRSVEFDGSNITFNNSSQTPTIDFTGATVSGAGFTFNQPAPGGSTEFGFDADTIDFGDGKTIDMQNCSVLFTGTTFSGWEDPNVVNTANNSAQKIVVGLNTAVMDFLTVRVAENTPGELDVEFNYDAGGTVSVSANGDVANRFNGTTTFAAGNTTWTVMNTLTTIGDKGEFTIVDHSGYKIYRVTTFAGVMPGIPPGEAHCVIERLK